MADDIEEESLISASLSSVHTTAQFYNWCSFTWSLRSQVLPEKDTIR